MRVNPLTQIDFYKADHRRQYPEGTTLVYSNFTPRSDNLAPVLPAYWDKKITFFGLQGFIQWFLIDIWNDGFFYREKSDVIPQYKRRMDNALGPDAIDISHIEALYDLGYLPLLIKALPEGSQVGMKVPAFTIENTKPEFFWLTNYFESVISTCVWKPCTTATIAFQYRKMLEHFARLTGAPADFVPVQCHDFSFRGLSGLHDAHSSSAGHLLSFVGTDSVPSIDYLEDYYYADSDKEMVGCSIPATEHSVMCMGGQEDEIETFRRLITEVYPTGAVSIVSDTWDFWEVMTVFAPLLEPEIMARQPDALGLNKVVFRPDSGDPVKIICGLVEGIDYDRSLDGKAYSLDLLNEKEFTSGGEFIPEHVVKGAIEVLWDTFGGTETDKGYKMLDEHVGLIYGDSITLERAQTILLKLEAKGFASNNIVFGVGSYTYQHVTRDCFGWAMKATYGEVDGVGREIFKDPATDNGTKKSAKGLLAVIWEDGEYKLVDQVDRQYQSSHCLMQTVFEDGDLVRKQTLSHIRGIVEESLLG